jgi:hypothetical protein
MAKPVTGLTQFQNNTVNSLVNLDNNFTAITQALNDPLSYTNYAPDSGVVNNLAITLTNYNISSYIDGQAFYVKVGFTNTLTAPSLNVNGLGAKTIYRQDGTAINVGDLIVGEIYEFVYNSSLNGFNSLQNTPSVTAYPIVLTASNAGTILNSLSNTNTGSVARVELDLSAAGQPGLSSISARIYADNATGSAHIVADGSGFGSNPVNLYIEAPLTLSLIIFKVALAESARFGYSSVRPLLIGTQTDNGVDRLQVNGTITTLNNQLKLGSSWIQQTNNANAWFNSAATSSGSIVVFNTASGAINGLASNSSGTITIFSAGIYEVVYSGVIITDSNNHNYNYYFGGTADTIVGPTSTSPQTLYIAGANGAVYGYLTMRATVQTTVSSRTLTVSCATAFGAANTAQPGGFITLTQIG